MVKTEKTEEESDTRPNSSHVTGPNQYRHRVTRQVQKPQKNNSS